MGFYKGGGHALFESVFVFLLYGVFGFMALMLIAIGAGVYGNLNDTINNNYDIRTSLSFVATKIRQGDEENGVFIKPFEGENALVIKETIDNTDYETWLYHYEGKLYELFIESGVPFTNISGDEIMTIEKFHIEPIENGGITLTAQNEKGIKNSLTLFLRTPVKGGALYEQ